MKTLKQPCGGKASSLLLFFSGWSASAELFASLEADEDADVIICYDYRDLTFEEDLSLYKEIHLVAWSMGVRMAEIALGGRYKFASATAINGTPCPIDDSYGIPTNIFLGTLNGLTPDTLLRFNRRMCGTREILGGYQSVPARPFDEVRDELRAIHSHCLHAQGEPIPWTRAIVGTGDRIFPSSNQLAYWEGRCPVLEIASPHYPFYLWTRWREL